MSVKQSTKVRRRLNPAVYSMLTGILFIVIGVMWLGVVDILIDIDGFGLGDVIHLLPYAGYATIALGVVMIFINLIRMVVSKPVVKETVVVKKKGQNPKAIQEVSKFEKKYIKGLIFDLDGTLLNTLEDLAESGNQVLQKHGLKTGSLETYRLGLGNGMRNLMKAVLPPEANESDLNTIHKEFLETYKLNYMNKTKPFEGIHDMLVQLSKRGYLMAVVSNKQDAFTKSLIKKHFPDILFVDVIGEGSTYPRKPDPILAKLIAEKMMLPVAQLALIGDSEVDFLTAKNAGMISFGVTWGYRSPKELIGNEPDTFIQTPAELVMQLDTLNQRDDLHEIPQDHLEIEQIQQIEQETKKIELFNESEVE